MSHGGFPRRGNTALILKTQRTFTKQRKGKEVFRQEGEHKDRDGQIHTCFMSSRPFSVIRVPSAPLGISRVRKSKRIVAGLLSISHATIKILTFLL